MLKFNFFIRLLQGKLGQREDKIQTESVNDPVRLVDLLTSPEIEVNGILPVNDSTLYVSWKYTSIAQQTSPTTSVVVAAFVTAQARLKLFKYLSFLGERAIYYDTDSVLYVSRIDDTDLPVGSMIGELTDELAGLGEGTYITRFVSGGPKFYAYEYIKCDGSLGYVCKVKGIRLNFANSQKINFESILSMISNDGDAIILNSSAIRRTKFHDVLTVKETKTCKSVYSKRVYVGFDKSYPFGYKRPRE